MKLVVGLGNPGGKYEGTRHNIGFEVTETLASRHGATSAQKGFQGEYAEIRLGGEKLLLLQPHTFMNLSGRSVQQAVAFYKIPLDDVLIVCDDLNLPAGKLRLRKQGTAGGQKGLANIIQILGTEEFPRLRLGIDRPPPGWETADYVLSKFRGEELELIDAAVLQACQCIETWVDRGIEAAMNKYN